MARVDADVEGTVQVPLNLIPQRELISYTYKNLNV